MAVLSGTPMSAVPGLFESGVAGDPWDDSFTKGVGPIPASTPDAHPPPSPGGGGTPDPASQVNSMTQRIMQALAQQAQRKQFAGTPVPGKIPGQVDPAEARSIGMNTANPHAWGAQRFMAGVQGMIQNAVSKKKEGELLKAEGDWSYLQNSLNDLYAAQASKDPEAIKQAQAKVDVMMSDPKKLKNMAKALNQDWLNPEKTTVYGEALKKVNAKTQQTDAQKAQARQGIKGLFQKLIQGQQRPQLTPEQQKAMGQEIQSKAPTTTPGLDPKSLEAQEKILHDRAEEARRSKQDETSAAYRKAETAVKEARLAQDKELKQKLQEETTRHHKVLETIQRGKGAGGGGTSSNAKDIAAAIKRGEQPPTTTGLYKEGAGVRAELARQGFNLQQAESDWHATQKHLATLNGPQQERLRQAVSFTKDSLGIIDDLYNQWEKVGKPGGWKVFNRGSLATAKQLPGEAGNIAHRLEAQINDLTSELGTVYKGGNTSTDESLKLAAENLKAEWNEKTFHDAITQIRRNLEIRENSIRNSQAAGVSADSPYTPRGETPKAKDPLGIF